MRVVILQSNYLPWRGYFDLIHDADHFIFYDEVKYTKNDWRNRNRIISQHGVQWLTVPIAKSAVHQKISEVHLPEGWQEVHFNKLHMNYRKAAHYLQLEPLLISFYKERNWERLSAFNQYAIKKIAQLFQIKTKFSDSSQYDLTGDRVNRLINLLTQVGATHYLSGPAGKKYLEGHENLFEEKSIQLEFKSYPNYKHYDQGIKSFEPFVSIVDLIANIRGEDISEYIWNSRLRT